MNSGLRERACNSLHVRAAGGLSVSIFQKECEPLSREAAANKVAQNFRKNDVTRLRRGMSGQHGRRREYGRVIQR